MGSAEAHTGLGRLCVLPDWFAMLLVRLGIINACLEELKA